MGERDKLGDDDWKSFDAIKVKYSDSIGQGT